LRRLRSGHRPVDDPTAVAGWSSARALGPFPSRAVDIVNLMPSRRRVGGARTRDHDGGALVRHARRIPPWALHGCRLHPRRLRPAPLNDLVWHDGLVGGPTTRFRQLSTPDRASYCFLLGQARGPSFDRSAQPDDSSVTSTRLRRRAAASGATRSVPAFRSANVSLSRPRLLTGRLDAGRPNWPRRQGRRASEAHLKDAAHPAEDLRRQSRAGCELAKVSRWFEASGEAAGVSTADRTPASGFDWIAEKKAPAIPSHRRPKCPLLSPKQRTSQ
jgi:hypothetical protein